jgi:predicted ArsR family transcriptional regulator
MEHFRVRNTDPLTSFEAADSLGNLADKHYQVILDCLSKFGALGKDGIANKTTLIGYQVGKRLTELERMGLIEQTGKTVKSNSGRSEREWKIKPTQLNLV